MIRPAHGGSWYYTPLEFLRSTYRDTFFTVGRFNTIGFRLVGRRATLCRSIRGYTPEGEMNITRRAAGLCFCSAVHWSSNPIARAPTHPAGQGRKTCRCGLRLIGRIR